MTSGREMLEKLPKAAALCLNRQFGSLDRLYATIYLVARNAHQCEMGAVPAADQRMRTIATVQGRLRFILDEMELDGKEIMDTIAGDYLEDFIHYRDPDFGLTDEMFIDILKKIL